MKSSQFSKYAVLCVIWSLVFAVTSSRSQMLLAHSYTLSDFGFNSVFVKTKMTPFIMAPRMADWGKETTKGNTNLNEGKYTVQVQAKNLCDVESTVASYTFSIVLPWYRSLAAYIVYAVIGGLFIWGIARARTNQLRRRNKLLEERVKDRTQKLMIVNGELNATLENLKVTQQQLINSEKMASIGQLIAGIAHEINNPLNFVSVGIQALESKYCDLLELLSRGGAVHGVEVEEKESEIKTLIQTINRGIDRATKIILGIRVFSSPSDEISLEARTDVRQSIELALLLLNSKLVDLRVHVTLDLMKVSVVANEAQLNQVLLNIIDNAIYALRDAPHEKKIHIATKTDGRLALISIKDNGPGIPLEIQKKIMDPFFTTKPVGQGVGLGLSISFGIIKKHQGELSFRSEVGKGTEFYISMPIAI
jgi:signal transduction histidine kinase